MKNIIYIFLLVVGISACNKEEDINPEVLGKWNTTNLTYNFLENGDYYMINKRSGTPSNPIIADSTFGTFITNEEKSQLTFYQTGYRDKATQTIVEKKTNFIWEFSIEGSLMTFSSPTTEGELTKID